MTETTELSGADGAESEALSVYIPTLCIAICECVFVLFTALATAPLSRVYGVMKSPHPKVAT